MSDLTPMMAQYLGIREQYRDAVLFFRLGDFYEMFNEDAVEVSRLLNLTLTKRGGSPMCGIPYHASRVYIARLLRAGKKIAICEQVTVNAPGKGLAERKVVEVITPGTVVDEDYLESGINNFLACLSHTERAGKRYAAMAWIDVSTGELSASSRVVSSSETGEAGEFLRREIGRLQPREVLVQQSLLDSLPEASEICSSVPGMVVNRYPDWSFNRDAAYRKLCAHLRVSSLSAFGLQPDDPVIPGAALLLEYLESTAGSAAAHVDGIKVVTEGEFVSIDDATRKNLELTRNLRDGGEGYTLLEVLDHTRTSMGKRLLRSWILSPLVDPEAINKRTDMVEVLYRDQRLLSRVRELLSGILDIERLAGRVGMGRAHGKDLVALSKSISLFLALTAISDRESFFSGGLSSDELSRLRDLAQLLDRSIQEDASTVLNEGGLIREGWSAKLDELRALRDNSRSVLEDYLTEERERTGIQNLKIRYNRMLGYYLEVSKGNLSSVPSHFIRRRSLAAGDRYTTDRLVELETELNGVSSGIIELEQELFLEIRAKTAEHVPILSRAARAVAAVDAIQSFARAATVSVWVRPTFTKDGGMHIADGRHPVVEAHLPSGEFVPNGIDLSCAEGEGTPSFALITGPNMAGKSTFLRQTALIAILAQIGSFVPASSVSLDPVDRVFCRVGASDNLARGESTFLVEMTETALILRSATRKSLVIMDEVGRGTSTEDGLSIAQAVTEYLLHHVGARTLFATHYHELSRITHPRLGDWCLEVLETEGNVVFLKRIKSGASGNSYGIHVARLAGIPEPVLQRAQTLLQEHLAASSAAFLPAGPISEEGASHPPARDRFLFSEEEMVIDEILSVDTDRCAPIEALQILDRMKKRLSGR